MIPWTRYAFIVFLTAADGTAHILVAPYLQSQGYDYTAIGLLVGVVSVFSLLSRLPGGMAYRPHRARALMAGSLVIFGLTCLAFPLATSSVLFGLLLAIFGATAGVATTVNLAIFMEAIPAGSSKHKAMAFYAGTLSGGHMIGNLSGGMAGDHLGYTGAFQLAAVYAVAGLGLLALDRLEVSEHYRLAPIAAPLEGWVERVRKPLRAMSEPGVVALSMVSFLQVFLHSSAATFFPLYGLSIGLSLTEIGLIKSAHSLTNAFARPLAGAPVQVLGAERVSYIGLAAVAVGVAIIPTQTSMVVLLGLHVVIGLLRALVMVANTVSLADVDETRMSRGLASGLFSASKDLGGLTSPVISGAAASLIGLASMMILMPLAASAIFFGLLAGLEGRVRLPRLRRILERAAP